MTLVGLLIAAMVKGQEDLDGLLVGFSPWTPLYTVQGGAGYKDNVLLSSFDPQASAFLRGSLELYLSRFPVDGRAVDFYLFWECTQYLEDVDVEREQLGFAQVQLKHDLAAGALAGLKLEYSHQDQVVDVSATEAQLTIVDVLGNGFAVAPTYRAELPGSSWLTVGAPVLRQYYEQPLDDYLEYGPEISWGLNYGHDSQLEWDYQYEVREYDTDAELTPDGMPIQGTTRVFQRHEGRWEWIHYWDADKRWQSTSRVSLQLNHDQGSGYFDYHRYRVFHRLRHRVKSWSWTVRGGISHYQYAQQTVSDMDNEKRRRTEYSVAARIERELRHNFRLYAEYGGEWIRGNIRSEEYRVATMLGGLMWDY